MLNHSTKRCCFCNRLLVVLDEEIYVDKKSLEELTRLYGVGWSRKFNIIGNKAVCDICMDELKDVIKYD